MQRMVGKIKYLNQIVCSECTAFMQKLPDACIDLTLTSPPYDNLRDYNGFMLDCRAYTNLLLLSWFIMISLCKYYIINKPLTKRIFWLSFWVKRRFQYG